MWLQILLSLIVIAIALGIAGLFLPSANTMLAKVGIQLPLLTADAATASGAGAAPQAQAQSQGQGAASQRQGAAGASGGGQGGRSGGAGGGQYGANRVAVVVAVPATSGIINNKLAAIGEGVGAKSVTVNTASGGTLMTVDVKPGDHVNAGAELATLDSDTQQNALDKAVLAVQDANSTLARTQALAKSNSVPASQVDTAQLAADNAKLAQQAAQIALDQRTITTPIAGTVGLIQVSAGNLINAQSVVTTIEDDSSILVNFWVPESYSSQVTMGQEVDVDSAALPGKAFKGMVTAIDNKIDPESRTLQIQATIPNPDGILKPGMSFSVDMAFPGETFPSVDPLSIQWSNQGAYVWKVVGDKVHKGMIDIVQRNSDGVLVKGDVKQGDPVVTQGVLQLSEGASIRLLNNGPTDTSGSSSTPAGPASAPGGTSNAVASTAQEGPPPPASALNADGRSGAAPTSPATDASAATGSASAPVAPSAPVGSSAAGTSAASASGLGG